MCAQRVNDSNASVLNITATGVRVGTEANQCYKKQPLKRADFTSAAEVFASSVTMSSDRYLDRDSCPNDTVSGLHCRNDLCSRIEPTESDG